MIAVWALLSIAVASQASSGPRTTVLLAETVKTRSAGWEKYQRWTFQGKKRFDPNGHGMYMIMGTGCGTCGSTVLYSAWGYLPMDKDHGMKSQTVMEVNPKTTIDYWRQTLVSDHKKLHIAVGGNWLDCNWRVGVVQAKNIEEGRDALRTALNCTEWFETNNEDETLHNSNFEWESMNG